MEISINYNWAKAYYDQAEYFKYRKNLDKAIVSEKKAWKFVRKLGENPTK